MSIAPMATTSMEVAVFTETNFGTRIAVSVSPDITAGDLKSKLGREHYLIFPSLGELQVNALMVKRNSCFYHLPDSLMVKNVFQRSKCSWFLKMTATRVEDVHSQAVDSTDNFHSQPGTIIHSIYHQEATTTVTNAATGKEEREISPSMNGAISESSSDIISVTGILTRYFSLSDEKNECNNEVESIRKTNEQYKESGETQMKEFGETQFADGSNSVASAGFFVEWGNDKKSRSQNNIGCLFIDSYVGESKCKTVNKINKKRSKADLSASVAIELTHLGEMGASLVGYDRSDNNQSNQQLEVGQSEYSIATKISKYSSAMAGLMSTRNKDRDTASNIINGESGAHHCDQDANVEEFQSNTKAKHKEIAVPACAMTEPVDFDTKRRITATTHSGQQDFNLEYSNNLEYSKCDIVSRTTKKHVKSKCFGSAVVRVGPIVLGKKGSSCLNADIVDDCGVHEVHQSSDVVKPEANLTSNIYEKHHNTRVSALMTGKMDLDKDRSEAVGENNIEDNSFHQVHQNCDVKKMNRTNASRMNQHCSKTEMSVFDPTEPTNIWKDGKSVTSDNKSYGRGCEINQDDSFNSGIGHCCSRNLDTDIGSAAKSPLVAFSLPCFGDPSTEASKNKPGRSEVGKRVIQAISELGISARKQTPLISICRSRTMAFSAAQVAKHLVFEIGNDDD